MRRDLLAMSYAPVLPVWLIIVAVLLSAGLSVWLALKYEGRFVSLLIRLLGIGALSWALLNPVLEEPGSAGAAQRPRVTILVDTSASMAQPDAGPGEDTGRLAYARQTWLAEPGLARLGALAELDIRAFDEGITGLRSIEQDPDGRATQLFDAVARAEGDIVVVVSDGHDTSGRGLPAPVATGPTVYAVPVGSARAAPDLSVQAWAQSGHLFAGQSTRITTQLYQRGLAGRTANVQLFQDEQMVEEQLVQLNDTLTEVGFDIQPDLPVNQPSRHHAYSVRATLADGGEASQENNRQDVFVQVSRERVRVLVLEGQPHWETRNLARVLAASPRFEVRGRYALGDHRRLGLDQSPSDAEGAADLFAGTDIVVLGRWVERLVTVEQARQLTRFVQESGGAVVFARGQPTGNSAAGDAVLAELTPITPVDFGAEQAAAVVLAESVQAGGDRSALTQLGEQVSWTQLPGMLAVTQVTGRRSASVVLLEARDEPGATTPGVAAAAVVTLRAGRGATLAVLTDGMWRWDLQGPASVDTPSDPLATSATAYATFWTRAAQWLASGGEFMPGQDIALQLSTMTTEPGQPVQLTASTRYLDTDRFAPRLMVTDPRGEQSELAAMPTDRSGTLRYEMMPEMEGVYRFALSTPGQPDLVPADQPIESRLVVADRAVEYRDTAARPDVLKQLTQLRGGRCLEVDEYQPLLEQLETLALTRATDARQRPVFNRWPVFALIGGSMGLHWLMRRRGGLL